MQSRYVTKLICNSIKEEPEFELESIGNLLTKMYCVKVYFNKLTVGSARFIVTERSVNILELNSATPDNANINVKVRHVGTALLEYVFKFSINNQKDGNLFVVSEASAVPFYFLYGFRVGYKIRIFDTGLEIPCGALFLELYQQLKSASQQEYANLKERILMTSTYTSLVQLGIEENFEILISIFSAQ